VIAAESVGALVPHDEGDQQLVVVAVDQPQRPRRAVGGAGLVVVQVVGKHPSQHDSLAKRPWRKPTLLSQKSPCTNWRGSAQVPRAASPAATRAASSSASRARRASAGVGRQPRIRAAAWAVATTALAGSR
jgi:hypothetical protein